MFKLCKETTSCLSKPTENILTCAMETYTFINKVHMFLCVIMVLRNKMTVLYLILKLYIYRNKLFHKQCK